MYFPAQAAARLKVAELRAAGVLVLGLAPPGAGPEYAGVSRLLEMPAPEPLVRVALGRQLASGRPMVAQLLTSSPAQAAVSLSADTHTALTEREAILPLLGWARVRCRHREPPPPQRALRPKWGRGLSLIATCLPQPGAPTGMSPATAGGKFVGGGGGGGSSGGGAGGSGSHAQGALRALCIRARGDGDLGGAAGAASFPRPLGGHHPREHSVPEWPRLLQHPYFCFVMVLLGWGLSEYLMVVSGKKLSVFTALFYNCVGPATLLFF